MCSRTTTVTILWFFKSLWLKMRSHIVTIIWDHYYYNLTVNIKQLLITVMIPYTAAQRDYRDYHASTLVVNEYYRKITIQSLDQQSLLDKILMRVQVKMKTLNWLTIIQNLISITGPRLCDPNRNNNTSYS